MPLTVDEYKVGQLFMIAKHSMEQSQKGEGVEVVENKPHEDPVHGKGQFTEKRIHLSSKLPSWIRSMVPKIFYVTEKAWNYYPFTITEYSCSFLSRFCVSITTKYENNNGCQDNIFNSPEDVLKNRTVDFVDIVFDECSAGHYKESEDLKEFKSTKTGRGPLQEGWRDDTKPIMCSYKLVEVKFDMMYLVQGRIENFIQSAIREVLLVGHRQAFAWIDDWYDMSIEDVREYESKCQEETNEKVRRKGSIPQEGEPQEQEPGGSLFATPSGTPPSGTTPTTPSGDETDIDGKKKKGKKGWFSWS